MQRTIGKEIHRVTDIENAKSNSAALNTLILRNYNDGRQGGWNNYCCYQGQNQGTYVNKKKTTKATKASTTTRTPPRITCTGAQRTTRFAASSPTCTESPPPAGPSRRI